MKAPVFSSGKWLYYLKLPFKRWAYEIIDQLVLHFVKAGNSGGVLVYRLDLMGDYLMCRPFFKFLGQIRRADEISVTFAGNRILSGLAEKLDGEIFREFIWIDRNQFINSIFYRFQILASIRRKGFSTVIQPSHTRQYWLESLVRVSGASRKITASTTGRYMEDWELALTSGWYHQIIGTGAEGIFEFYRNRNFFSALCPEAARTGTLQDPLFSGVPKQNLILLAPGASTPERKWPAGNFSRILRELASQFPGFSFALIGAPSEKEECRNIIQESGIPARCYAGEYSAADSMFLLAGAKLLISNESGPVHMAATTGTACVCISNGNHFARWNPYPAQLAGNILTCYPDAFGNIAMQREKLIRLYHAGSQIQASEIRFEPVLQSAVRLLRLSNSTNL